MEEAEVKDRLAGGTPRTPVPLTLGPWRMPEAPRPETGPPPVAGRDTECCPEDTGLKRALVPEGETFSLPFPRCFCGEREMAKGPRAEASSWGQLREGTGSTPDTLPHRKLRCLTGEGVAG